jgi:hypothetical protein
MSRRRKRYGFPGWNRRPRGAERIFDEYGQLGTGRTASYIKLSTVERGFERYCERREAKP